MTEFNLELIKAVSDWQRGGSPAQKAKRGAALKSAAAKLNERFKRVSLVCFRQVALDKGAVWKLADSLHLVESISAWTLATEVAIEFKGGVPPHGHGYQGVIFAHVPSPDQIVVSLQALYEDLEFREACRAAASEVPGFFDGSGRWQGSQHEVVLEVNEVRIETVYALGGHSSSAEYFLRVLYGPDPSLSQIDEFNQLLAAATRKTGRKLGPNWLVGEAKDRVLTKALETVADIRSRSTGDTG